MMQIVDGKKIAEEILDDLRFRIKDLRVKPKLAVLLVGDNPASLSYIKIKQKMGQEIGILVDIHRYPIDTSEARIVDVINKCNLDLAVSGIIIQLPLPEHLDRKTVLNTVRPENDVDCLTEFNKKLLVKGRPRFIPPAAAAVLKILEDYGIALKQKNILLVGSGDLIGKPLSAILSSKHIPFTVAAKKTENLAQLSSKADIIITGVGKANLITGDLVKDGAVVIDAGTTGSDEGIVVGDVEFNSVSERASLLSPVPGGVGPVTVAMLLANVVNSALHR